MHLLLIISFMATAKSTVPCVETTFSYLEKNKPVIEKVFACKVAPNQVVSKSCATGESCGLIRRLKSLRLKMSVLVKPTGSPHFTACRIAGGEAIIGTIFNNKAALCFYGKEDFLSSDRIYEYIKKE